MGGCSLQIWASGSELSIWVGGKGRCSSHLIRGGFTLGFRDGGGLGEWLIGGICTGMLGCSEVQGSVSVGAEGLGFCGPQGVGSWFGCTKGLGFRSLLLKHGNLNSMGGVSSLVSVSLSGFSRL